ncbi:hypothetical protein COV12_02210, partial [Candidatus Woesearchaeota archaeon CG10_big_fil_rev_8_21_14_0_10_32_24]
MTRKRINLTEQLNWIDAELQKVEKIPTKIKIKHGYDQNNILNEKHNFNQKNNNNNKVQDTKIYHFKMFGIIAIFLLFSLGIIYLSNNMMEPPSTENHFLISLISGSTNFITGAVFGLAVENESLKENITIKIPEKIISPEPVLIQDPIVTEKEPSATQENMLDIFSGFPPEIETIAINSTDPDTNDTNQNITAHVTTSDLEFDDVKLIYNWFKDEVPIAILNMPFEANGGNEATNTFDYSGSANDGVITSAMWSASSGYDGKGSYSFIGTGQYVTLTDEILNTATPTVTYVAWLNPADTAWRRIFKSTSGGDGGWYTTGSIVKLYGGNCASAAVVPASSWSHFAYTYDGTTSKIYVNGQLEDTDVEDCREPTGIKYIGRDDGGEHFSGGIDEVMIFNQSLSADQIQALYENRTNLIVSDETDIDEVWNFSVTPNDGSQDGTTNYSEGIIIETEAPAGQVGTLATFTDDFSENPNDTFYYNSTLDMDFEYDAVAQNVRMNTSVVAADTEGRFVTVENITLDSFNFSGDITLTNTSATLGANTRAVASLGIINQDDNTMDKCAIYIDENGDYYLDLDNGTEGLGNSNTSILSVDGDFSGTLNLEFINTTNLFNCSSGEISITLETSNVGTDYGLLLDSLMTTFPGSPTGDFNATFDNLVYSLDSEAAPTIDTIAINSTDPTTNNTNQNITAHVTASDANGDDVKLIY